MSLRTFALDTRHFGVCFTLHRQLAKARARAGISELTLPGFGTFFTRDADTDFETVRQVMRDGEYDVAKVPAITGRVLKRYRAILASGKHPLIIDAGANVGAAAVFFAETYPEAHIVAIEPDTENIGMLRRNTASRPNVSIIEAAVGSSSGYVSVDSFGRGWATRTTRSDAGCPLVTVPEVVATTDGELFIVKVDIEGFEADLFSRSTEWLQQTTLLMIEPHDWMTAGTSTSFQRTMGELGFEIYVRAENLFYLNPKLA